LKLLSREDPNTTARDPEPIGIAFRSRKLGRIRRLD